MVFLLQSPFVFLLQVAIKNNIDVFYFSCLVPMHVLFVEDGEMEKRVFLATWKDIPAQNEVQHEICNVQHNAGIESIEVFMKVVFLYLYMHCQCAYDFRNEFNIEDSSRIQKLQHCTLTCLYINMEMHMY